MKRFFYLLAGIISLSFASCENNNSAKSFALFSSASDLNGIWVEIGGAFSIEANGDKLTLRQHDGYIDADNNFICTSNKSWDDLITHTVKYEFEKDDQSIFISGVKAGTFTRLGKDRASFKKAMSLWLTDCELQRVKSVKTLDDIDTNPDTPENTVATNGALHGKFSVSASTKVQFSQGNLQYKASTNTWRFAVQQYYYVGNKNKNISESYDGWIDLFGWGTGDNPTLSSQKVNDYADWGANKISNGGNKANQWRTLTKDEWVYLFHGRSNAQNLFGFGSVNGVPGVIILPDNWTTPSGLVFYASTAKGLSWQGEYYRNSKGNNFSHNAYSSSEWPKMEAAGAVFLPAAGYREGTDVNFVGSDGYYWSSTPYDSYSAYAYYVDFNKYCLVPQYYGGRIDGRSVRLVR